MPASQPQATSNLSISKLKDKQAELAAIIQLNEMTGSMSDQVTLLSTQFSLGADGLQAIESVVQKFQNVFVYAQKAIAARTEAATMADTTMTQATSQVANRRRVIEEDTPIDMLVRIPLPESNSPEPS
ncbi:uncharacterized protein MELLADRAFT_109307 [Melampsora larici-populina 98AG31]|uniref:DASH complex subunit DAD2 n=1 Tax=Melampsora larici-populina (strain 98AG31 / pathotype 3-4-7) TaxID=747676 RepID=F4RW19_MELLP|nr:uncharacterized protein MELLADRAFT_109307 [Melampsora larici-populina 98AG31]EGG03488.1 hypothetical protein MELLADRAFT_109307 [Melampsora larici-populina 98AG31]